MRVNRSTVFCQITEIHLPSQTMIGSTFSACWFANRLTLERLRACRLETLRPSRTVQSCPRWACRLERLHACELVLTFCSNLDVWFPLDCSVSFNIFFDCFCLFIELGPSSLQPSPFNRITIIHAPLIVDRFDLVVSLDCLLCFSVCHIVRFLCFDPSRPYSPCIHCFAVEQGKYFCPCASHLF